jgi:Arc/MetJ-type ribon-helix-helix transcriptional regulator
MPDNGDAAFIPIKTTLTRRQADFIDSMVSAGDALSRAEAVRNIVKQAMELEKQKTEG